MKELQVIKGDALSLAKGILVHGCNNIGVMGSGIAAGVKARFPHVYNEYMNHHANGMKLGEISMALANDELIIINAVTQTLGQQTDRLTPVSYDAINTCFHRINAFLEQIDTEHEFPLCFPMIGAARGGGNWDVILQIIKSQVNPNRQMILYVVDSEPADCR